MMNSKTQELKRDLEDLLKNPISTEINQDFAPAEYSIASDGRVSLKFIKRSADKGIYRTEMERFEGSQECILTFIIQETTKVFGEEPTYAIWVLNQISQAYGVDDAGREGFTTFDKKVKPKDWYKRSWLEPDKYQMPISIHQEGEEIHFKLFLRDPT
jgi:hypothetical protein